MLGIKFVLPRHVNKEIEGARTVIKHLPSCDLSLTVSLSETKQIVFNLGMHAYRSISPRIKRIAHRNPDP